MKIKNNKNIIKTRIASFFLIIGLIGWFIPFVDRGYYPKLEYPNTLRQGLCVDEFGNIFCGSQTYERIQMYDKDGTFVRGFSTDIERGSGYKFTFEIKNKQLHIHVFGTRLKSKRLDREIVYSLDGTLLCTTDIQSTGYASYNVENETRDSFGQEYVFKGFLFPRVIKNAGENSSVIISTPFYWWLLQAPFPAFAIFFVSLLTSIGFKGLFNKRKSRNSISPLDNV